MLLLIMRELNKNRDTKRATYYGTLNVDILQIETYELLALRKFYKCHGYICYTDFELLFLQSDSAGVQGVLLEDVLELIC